MIHFALKWLQGNWPWLFNIPFRSLNELSIIKRKEKKRGNLPVLFFPWTRKEQVFLSQPDLVWIKLTVYFVFALCKRTDVMELKRRFKCRLEWRFKAQENKQQVDIYYVCTTSVLHLNKLAFNHVSLIKSTAQPYRGNLIFQHM